MVRVVSAFTAPHSQNGVEKTVNGHIKAGPEKTRFVHTCGRDSFEKIAVMVRFCERVLCGERSCEIRSHLNEGTR